MAVRGTAHNCSNSKRDNHGCTIMGTGTELHHRNTHILVVDVMVPAKTLPSGVSDLLSLSLYLRQSGFLPWNTQIKKKMGVQNLYETFKAINLGITTRTAHVPISLYHTHKHKTQSKQRPRLAPFWATPSMWEDKTWWEKAPEKSGQPRGNRTEGTQIQLTSRQAHNKQNTN